MTSDGNIARANHVVRVAPATWGLAEWYSDAEMEGFAGDSDPSEDRRAIHQQKTLMGVQLARARGVKIGRTSPFSPEQMEVAKRMAAEGMSTRAIAETFGVSSTAVIKWKAK